jgi:hypothetical protein
MLGRRCAPDFDAETQERNERTSSFLRLCVEIEHRFVITWKREDLVANRRPRPNRALMARMASKQSKQRILVAGATGQLLAFAIAVSVHDCVAPERGRRKLADYLRDRVAQKV